MATKTNSLRKALNPSRRLVIELSSRFQKLYEADLVRRRLAGIVMPRFYFCAATIVAMALTLATRTQAQAVQSPETPSGQITGTVTDVEGDSIVGATVILTRSPDPTDQRTALTTENGFFR